MSNDNINVELQKKLLDIFKWFHELCDKEGLVYFALGGTALGAARHKGFIPWDDDMDVGMPRKDYEKLKNLSKKINSENSRFKIEFPGNEKEHLYPYCKIYNTQTTLIENTRYKVKRGIYIDVFPVDGAGNSVEESLSNFRAIDKKINLLCCCVCAIRKGRPFHKNLAIVLARCIPTFILNPAKMINKIDELCQLKKFDECEFVANFAGNWHEKEIMEKRWIGKRKLVEFDGSKMYVVQDNDSYLTRMYGDYMKLPSVEKRVSHHDYIYMNLGEAYLECK